MVTKKVSNAVFFGEKDKRAEVLEYFAGMEKLAKIREKMKTKEAVKKPSTDKNYFE